MQQVLTWRQLLGNIISDPRKRQRIADELGITSAILEQWARGEINPREHALRRLAQILPEYRALLLELVSTEFPGFSMSGEERIAGISDKIPAAFYARAINAYATTPDAQRFWLISNLLLQQALAQLDPNQTGMAITIVQCMPPTKDGKVRSLRVRAGRGTPPWDASLDSRALFLGAESLVGYTVTHGQSIFLQHRGEREGLYPVHWVEWEESAAAIPIMRAGDVAGSLLVSCARPNYLPAPRQKLIQSYARLISLIFDSSEFYSMQDINLYIMPNYRIQERHLTGFSQRISTIMRASARSARPLTIIEAEKLAWQQLEEELILLAGKEEKHENS